MHSLQCWHFFGNDRSIEHRNMQLLPHWHILGSRVIILLRSMCSWYLHRSNNKCLHTLLFWHVPSCWWIDYSQLLSMSSGLIFIVVMAANFLCEVQHWHLQRSGGRFLYSMCVWELCHFRGFLIMYGMCSWHVHLFPITAL